MKNSPLTNPIFLLEDPSNASSVFASSVLAFADKIKNAGFQSFYASQRDFDQNFDFSNWTAANSRPVIAYGSIQFIRKINFPHLAYGWTGTDWNEFTAHIPRHMLLNSEYVMTTWGDFKRNSDYWFQVVDPNYIFVRPNSGKKTFAGTVVSRMDAEHFFRGHDATTSVVDETIIVLAPALVTMPEWRLFVVNREIVGCGRYFPDNIIGRHRNTPVTDFAQALPTLYEFARSITQLEWQPDACYSFDVMEDENVEPKLVEINSFCSAGLYGAANVDMVKALVRQAIRDYSV